MFTNENGVIKNEQGEVAIAYYQPAEAYVDGSRVPSGRGYAFRTERAVCMAWVDPRDVAEILSITKVCSACGNKSRKLFAYATPGQVSIWATGRRGETGESEGCGGCGR